VAIEQLMYRISGCILSSLQYLHHRLFRCKGCTFGAWDTGSDNFDANPLFEGNGDENVLIKILQELEHAEK
jgi:hypothetical protein